VLMKLQGVARGGEMIYHDGYRLTVVGIHGQRITKVKLEKTRGPAS
jgi:hypothetical protein